VRFKNRARITPMRTPAGGFPVGTLASAATYGVGDSITRGRAVYGSRPSKNVPVSLSRNASSTVAESPTVRQMIPGRSW
jgi:hypothetical protein